MDIKSQGFTSIEQIRSNLNSNPTQTAKVNGLTSTEKQSFSEIFKEASTLHFSKHASERLETRNISMTASQKARLEDATVQAKAKGMKDSLVMVDNLAFIVNVKSNTVVTAVGDMKQGIFTNIDGAIIN